MPARRLVLAAPAERDLTRYWQTIVANNTEAVAAEQVRSLLGTAERIASFPEIGRSRPLFGHELWSFPTQSHIVFYQIHDDRIVIIRFVPARMDIEEEMLSFLKEHFGLSDET